MARTCRLVRAGRSLDAQWRRDGDVLIVSPTAAPALVVPLGEVSGLGGDGFTVRLRTPGGEIALERLGGDGPTLLEELWRDWPVARASVLRLAGGERPAAVHAGKVTSPGYQGAFRGFLVEDRLVVAPEDGDVTVFFVADFASVVFDAEAYALRATRWDGGHVEFSRLGGGSAAFTAALVTARERLSCRAAEVLARHLPALPAGPRADLASQWLPGRLLSFADLERIAPGFESAIASSWLAATPRSESGLALMAGVPSPDRYLGYAKASATEAPFLWLLVLQRRIASLELLSHVDCATYLFHKNEEIAALVQGLLRLPEFSREALYLPLDQLSGERAMYAIPARDLPLLRDLRASFADRKIHAPRPSG